jgi:hypothetical protein
MNNKLLVIFIIIIVLVIIFFYKNIKILLYNFFFTLLINYKLLTEYDEHEYLHKNFDKIFTNIENINSENYFGQNSVNACLNSKNQYKIVNMNDEKYLIKNIIEYNDVNTNLYKLLEKILTNIHINGQLVDINNCVVFDLLFSNIQLFPSIHTDIEWNLLNKSNGFQVWYLYKNNDQVGNMFLIETDNVLSNTYLVYNKDNTINIYEQCSKKNVGNYNNTNKLNPSVKYLDMKDGECLIFGKNLYHMSDYRLSTYRYSLNFRVIIKDEDGGIPINLSNNCLYNENFMKRIKNKNIKYTNGKIYPKMFDLIYMI